MFSKFSYISSIFWKLIIPFCFRPWIKFCLRHTFAKSTFKYYERPHNCGTNPFKLLNLVLKVLNPALLILHRYIVVKNLFPSFFQKFFHCRHRDFCCVRSKSTVYVEGDNKKSDWVGKVDTRKSKCVWIRVNSDTRGGGGRNKGLKPQHSPSPLEPELFSFNGIWNWKKYYLESLLKERACLANKNTTIFFIGNEILNIFSS